MLPELNESPDVPEQVDVHLSLCPVVEDGEQVERLNRYEAKQRDCQQGNL